MKWCGTMKKTFVEMPTFFQHLRKKNMTNSGGEFHDSPIGQRVQKWCDAVFANIPQNALL